uniref:Uncharacterized protein n=1 Tax=Cyanoderma ruficeps TaxID=181631 RepID=A0A8C3P6E0_9PASS
MGFFWGFFCFWGFPRPHTPQRGSWRGRPRPRCTGRCCSAGAAAWSWTVGRAGRPTRSRWSPTASP